MKTVALFLLLLLPGVGARAAAAPSGTLAEAWQLLANYRPDQALPKFEQLAARGGADARTARLGAALSLLAQPSTVPDRVAKAGGLLAGLAADGADDSALAAQFYLSRLAEFQSEPPDPVKAAAGFQRLIAEHPDSIWAQAAVPRLAILLLYTAAGPTDPAGKIAAAELLVKSARQPLAVMELHLVISDAVFHHRLPDGQALPHLLAAEQTGGLDPGTRADVLVQIGELSRLTGQPAQAARYYRTFLAAYPRDARQYSIRRQLASVGAAQPSP
jgi:hypothetical protein